MLCAIPHHQADRDAARKRHEEQGLTFLEVFMDVPISVVQERDPKGLYAKVYRGFFPVLRGLLFFCVKRYFCFFLTLKSAGILM